jgi:hypothetical protein
MEWFSKLAYERSKTELVGETAASYWAVLKKMVEAAKDEYNLRYPATERHEQAEYVAAGPNEIVLKRVAEDPQTHQFTDEKSHVKVVFEPAGPKPARITAIYSTTQASVALTVALGGNGYAVMRRDEHDVTLDHACELILAPILFGELQD